MLKITLVLLIFLTFLFPIKASAAVKINEFYAAGTSSSDPDWVELYNDSTGAIDISIYRLRDSTTTNKIDLSGTIPANGFATFDWSNKLNADGDLIRLLLISDDSTAIDQVGYGTENSSLSAPASGQSAGRSPNGLSTWLILSTLTKNSSNPSITPTPSPTPSPAVTPTSSSTPTPTQTSFSPTSTPTPTQSATNTPTPTRRPTNTPTPTPTPSATPTPEEILGIQDETTPTPKEESQGSTWLKKEFLIAAVLGISGLGLLGFSVYSFLKGRKDVKKNF